MEHTQTSNESPVRAIGLYQDHVSENHLLRAYPCSDVKIGYLAHGTENNPYVFDYSNLDPQAMKGVDTLKPGDPIELDIQWGTNPPTLTSLQKIEKQMSPIPQNTEVMIVSDVFPARRIMLGIPCYKEHDHVFGTDASNPFDILSLSYPPGLDDKISQVDPGDFISVSPENISATTVRDMEILGKNMKYIPKAFVEHNTFNDFMFAVLGNKPAVRMEDYRDGEFLRDLEYLGKINENDFELIHGPAPSCDLLVNKNAFQALRNAHPDFAERVTLEILREKCKNEQLEEILGIADFGTLLGYGHHNSRHHARCYESHEMSPEDRGKAQPYAMRLQERSPAELAFLPAMSYIEWDLGEEERAENEALGKTYSADRDHIIAETLKKAGLRDIPQTPEEISALRKTAFGLALERLGQERGPLQIPNTQHESLTPSSASSELQEEENEAVRPQEEHATPRVESSQSSLPEVEENQPQEQPGIWDRVKAMEFARIKALARTIKETAQSYLCR